MANIRATSSKVMLLLFLVVGCAHHPTPDQAAGLRLYEESTKHRAVGTLTDEEVQTILRDNATLDGQADGWVFGIVDDHGTRVFSAGTLGAGTGRKVDGDTLFKIGSITKVFTAILLQDMLDHGQMNLDDPVQKYLPPSVTMPTRSGKPITLFDLATHTSGLPRDGDGGDVEHLYAFLSHYELPRDPGSQWEYSNLAVGLLGHVISLKAGKDYETLVVERICQPLGMDSTRLTLAPELKSRAAQGHVYPGRPVADGEWHGPLEGCGALYSTANDLLKFVSGNLGLTPSPLTPLLQRSQGLQWVSSRSGRLVWFEDAGTIGHGGNTGGFVSDMVFDPAKRRGIVSLANCGYGRIRFVCKPLLNQQSPKPARMAAIDPKLLDSYVGTYQDGQNSACVVRRDGDRLTFQWWNGRPWHSLPLIRLEGFPQSNCVFYNQLWDGPATFDHDARGRVTRFTMKAATWAATWTKVSDQLPAQTPVQVDPAVYEQYVGQYRHALFGLIPVGPTFNAYVTQDHMGTHLMGYISGSDHGELYPATETTVINPDLDGAWITFSHRRSKNGKSTGVLVHFNGDDIDAKRISDRPDLPPGR